MNRWTCGRVSASTYCGCCFDLQWWRLRCSLLMSPTKVETAVPYVARRFLPDFPVMIILIYHYIHDLFIYQSISVFFFKYLFIYLRALSIGVKIGKLHSLQRDKLKLQNVLGLNYETHDIVEPHFK